MVYRCHLREKRYEENNLFYRKKFFAKISSLAVKTDLLLVLF